MLNAHHVQPPAQTQEDNRMTFFYDLNKRLADLANKQDAKQLAESKQAESIAKSPLTQALNESAVVERSTGDYSAKKARAGKDIGKPGKNFGKIAKSAGERYGSKAAGERVAGAVLNKLRHPKEDVAQEGNAFTGALAKTPKGGKFKVGNKEFTDTSSLEETGMEAMTPKQKSFAKLAPPTDKITFADKIAGAKKEVDEMLGDVAANAIKSAITKGHKGTVTKTAKGLKHRATSAYGGSEDEPHPLDRMKGPKSVKEMERSSSGGEIHKTATGLRHVAKDRYAGMDDEDEDDTEATPARGKGRPKGTKRAIGAKGPTGKSKLLQKDSIKEEGKDVCPHCGHEMVDEKAVSKKQQKFMGMVHAAQKGEKPASKEVSKVAKEMPKKAAKDFASTKQKDLPEKVKAKKEESKEEVEETTTSGSVATSTAAPKAGKGMQFGKGVYESLDKQFKQALTESISVQNTVSECGDEMGQGITIQADGNDAQKLMMLLKLAGLDQQMPATCPTCGQSPCACAEVVDENSPDWPTNTEEGGENDPNLNIYSGGLNKPKSTGQTTTPVIASQLRRQVSMEEGVELERTLFNTWKNYKG